MKFVVLFLGWREMPMTGDWKTIPGFGPDVWDSSPEFQIGFKSYNDFDLS